MKGATIVLLTLCSCQVVRGALAAHLHRPQQKRPNDPHQSPSPWSTKSALAVTGGTSAAAAASAAAEPSPSSSPPDDFLAAADAAHAAEASNVALPLPTLRQYRKFALPCLGLWIAGPLLSLVDTSFIGLSGDPSTSAQNLAALGPATTFFDGATYLFAFLNVATTNLYSSARAQAAARNGPNDEQDTTVATTTTGGPKAESVVRAAAQVSVNCGIGIMLFLIVAARPLLALYIGEKAAATPGLLDSAVDYVSIRALSLPTSLLLGVVQASLLGAKDSVTPLIAIVYSTLVNLVGDYIFVNRFKYGLQGAALATTLAQWAGTAALMGPATKRLFSPNNRNLMLWQNKQGPKRTTPPEGSSGNGSDDDDNHVTGRAFLSFAAPVLTLILGKLAAFGFMTHAAAAVPGQPTPLAAHQILLSLLFFSTPFFEVISQTAQTFLPPFLQRKKESDQSKKNGDPTALKVASQLMGLGLSVAGIVATVAWLVPSHLSFLLTSDATVQAACKPLAKWLWMGAFFWAPVAVSEGVLLARRELGFLATVYLVSTALLPPALLQVKFRKGTVGQVWACFAVFQLFRAFCFTLRIWGEPVMNRLFGGKFKKQSEAAGVAKGSAAVVEGEGGDSSFPSGSEGVGTQ